jgi:ABC-type proline/glycine betaine transport system permease subunit
MPSRAAGARQAVFRAFTVVLVLLGLAACWELYRWVWSSAGWTWPFPVDDTTMPHLWTIAKAFGQPAQVNQPALITILLHKALFTAKEAAVGFAIGAIVGFVLGIVLAHSRLLQRGFLPYIVASQTIPILAIAPMVVVWVNPKLPGPFQGWGAVAVIAAYLTGKDDFSKIPNGGPGIENRLQMIRHFGVRDGRITLNRMVELLATNPAKLFGLYPRKGTLAVGSDADIVVFDPERKFTISASTHHSKVDYNLYKGTEVQGSSDVVLLRGNVLVADGVLVAKPGIGRFVARAKFGEELKSSR